MSFTPEQRGVIVLVKEYFPDKTFQEVGEFFGCHHSVVHRSWLGQYLMYYPTRWVIRKGDPNRRAK